MSNSRIDPWPSLTELAAKESLPNPRAPRWSHRAFALFGIPIRIHFTFWLLPLWMLPTHLLRGLGVRQTVMDVLTLAAVFACVVLHELSHALTARRFGIRTREITLLPIGGVANLERLPDKPIQELAVALAGPAASFMIAACFYGVHWLLHGRISVPELSLEGASFLAQLVWINLTRRSRNQSGTSMRRGVRIQGSGVRGNERESVLTLAQAIG